MNRGIAAERLDNQRIAHPGPAAPAALVAWFGAVQAQDFADAIWALALRSRKDWTARQLGRAFDEGRILRTHVLRPTWHFVAPPDIHWLLELTAPRVHQAMAYAHRYYEVDRALRVRAAAAFERALAGGRYLTRAELGAHLATAGIAATGIRLGLLTMDAELERVVCSGPRRGAQMTYALLAERVPRARRLSRDEALAEVTRRYLRSHGPATVRDCAWWSGLTTVDVRRGLEINRARSRIVDGLTYWTVARTPFRGARRGGVQLLPNYDEYLVAYRDLDAVPRTSVSLQRSVLIGGQVAGGWKAARTAGGVTIQVNAHRRLADAERCALEKAARRLGAFLETPASLVIA